jgi:uncharacterized protein (TIGR03437 family)
MSEGNLSKLYSAVLLLCTATAIAAHAQTLTTLVNFNGTNGSFPNALIQGNDGNLYGTTVAGGAYDDGTLFKFALSGGVLTTVYSFGATSEDPIEPEAGLIQGSDGNFYGVTPQYAYGGPGATVFKVTPTGTGSALHIFTFTEGSPYGGLIQANDGNLYGTTENGQGTTAKGSGTFYGWIFKLTPSGTLTPLYIFGETSNVDGSGPEGSLIQASDGNLYGTTQQGGTGHCLDSFSLNVGCGTVFQATLGGAETPLYSFLSTLNDGINPIYGLIQASDGNFYGTTPVGGANGYGTIFQITPAGTLNTLYSFGYGCGPGGSLIQATDGNLYGITSYYCGSHQAGTIFSITLGGTLTTVYNFCSQAACADGRTPSALLQGADGNFYGTTSGGSSSHGTVFKLVLASVPAVTAVVNGASFVGGGVVPGEIATAFGTNLTSSTGVNLTSSLPLPNTFLTDSLMVNNEAVSLFAVDNANGQQQINFQVPWEVASGPTATISVSNNGTAGASISVPVLAAQPGIFNYSAGGNTFGAILHANFQLADSANPAKPGETVLIYCTGLGAVASPPADGAAGNGEVTLNTPTVMIGGEKALVSFSGLAPGFVGLYQVNAEVPTNLKAGNQAVTVEVSGASSNSVLLPVG